jgi:hypothetical protein
MNYSVGDATGFGLRAFQMGSLHPHLDCSRWRQPNEERTEDSPFGEAQNHNTVAGSI